MVAEPAALAATPANRSSGLPFSLCGLRGPDEHGAVKALATPLPSHSLRRSKAVHERGRTVRTRTCTPKPGYSLEFPLRFGNVSAIHWCCETLREQNRRHNREARAQAGLAHRACAWRTVRVPEGAGNGHRQLLSGLVSGPVHASPGAPLWSLCVVR